MNARIFLLLIVTLAFMALLAFTAQPGLTDLLPVFAAFIAVFALIHAAVAGLVARARSRAQLLQNLSSIDFAAIAGAPPRALLAGVIVFGLLSVVLLAGSVMLLDQRLVPEGGFAMLLALGMQSLAQTRASDYAHWRSAVQDARRRKLWRAARQVDKMRTRPGAGAILNAGAVSGPKGPHHDEPLGS